VERAHCKRSVEGRGWENGRRFAARGLRTSLSLWRTEPFAAAFIDIEHASLNEPAAVEIGLERVSDESRCGLCGAGEPQTAV